MKWFGLTGGIASGKSSVARRLRARGVPVVDADELAREVVAPGSDGLRAVVEAFGDEVLDADGALDRKKVASIVFADAERRRILNAITHPRIALLGIQRGEELAAKGEPLACYEAALIVENRAADAFRPLVVVAASEDAQVKRASARDGASDSECRARIRAQLALSEKIAVADYVIDNSSTLADLEQKTDEFLAKLCRTLGIDEARYPKPAASTPPGRP